MNTACKELFFSILGPLNKIFPTPVLEVELSLAEMLVAASKINYKYNKLKYFFMSLRTTKSFY